MAARSALPDADAQPDAPSGNWVDRLAPEAWRPWLHLSRVDRPIGTWLLLLPCWWGIGLAMIAQGPLWRDLWIAAACGIGALVMRGAGCTWNDFADRDIDARVARTRNRPLASGRITPRGALVWLVLQALIGLGLLLTLGPAAISMGILSILPFLIYPFAKRFTWWPQIFLGIAFNWGAMLAWTAHAGRLEAPAVVLWLAGIAWTLVYDTIYAHQDIEDDVLAGVKSTARLFGDATRRWLVLFAALSVLLMGLAVVLARPVGPVSIILAACAVAGFGAHLAWQLRRFRLNETALALRLFRSNRDAGLIAALLLAVAGLA